jgi:hypothetical protein
MRRLDNEQLRDSLLHIPVPWVNRNIIYLYKDCRLNMYVPNKYPFEPPKVICGNTDHIGYFSRKKRYFQQTIDIYYSKFRCPCCYSITCDWSPSMTIRHLADEYIDYTMKMRVVINTYLIDKVGTFTIDLMTYITSFLQNI